MTDLEKMLIDAIAELKIRVAVLEKRADMPVRDGHALWKPAATPATQEPDHD